MSGSGIPRVSGSFAVAAAYTTGRHKVVHLTDDFIVTRSTAATDKAIGVMEDNTAAIGDAVEVTVHGETLVVAGGGISQGDFLVSDSNGDVVAITPAATTPNYVVGRALQDAVDNDIFKAFINPIVVNV